MPRGRRSMGVDLDTPEQAEQYRDALAGVEVRTHEPTAADLDGFAAEVESADR